MAYEIWDVESGNIVGAFASEEEALELIRESLRTYGDGYVQSLLLGREDARGQSHAIAEGKDLVEYVTRTARKVRELPQGPARYQRKATG